MPLYQITFTLFTYYRLIITTDDLLVYVCRPGEDKMVVGRTLWDFIIEAAQTPGLRIILLVLITSLDALLIIIIILIYNGLLAVKFNYGGLAVEMHHLPGMMD